VSKKVVHKKKSASGARQETRKLEAPTKSRFLLLLEEVKFPEFLGVLAGQIEKEKKFYE